MKKIPLRKCVATNEQLPKQEMFRIVRTTDGTVALDFTGKLNGRGAYLKMDKDAIELAKTKKCLDRALECKIPNEIYERMISYIK